MQTSIDMAYADLANAIVVQAVTDYRNALRGISYNRYSPEEIIKQIEKFFLSDYYATLTRIKGEYLIYMLKREYDEEEKCKSH